MELIAYFGALEEVEVRVLERPLFDIPRADCLWNVPIMLDLAEIYFVRSKLSFLYLLDILFLLLANYSTNYVKLALLLMLEHAGF